jgi:cytochrome c oxidase assembly protein subunit 15
VLPAALQPSLPVGLRWKLALVPALACLQVALGIGTLLYVVPLPLAATHQVTAFLLFGASLYSLNQLKARAAPAR